MIRTDRICIMIFLGSFILMLPSFAFLKFADELCAYGLLALALADCFANGNWNRY